MINYYVFDEIKFDGDGCYWGYKENDFCEVYPLSSEDSKQELMEKGFAFCDAPGTETFIVEETAYSCLK